METTCDSIHITWKAPANVGGWSPVTDYAVFIEATELVPFEDSLPTATDDAAVRALPHKVAYRQTNFDLTGLVPSTEYTAMVLPRNGKGWGSQWSEPLRATTDPTVLPPQKAAAPAVRPAEGCRAAYVRVPTASIGCRAADEFLLQVLLEGTERGWTTLQHAEPGSIAQMTGFGPGSSFAVRLVAQNAHGAAPPSESTAITPGPFGGCNSERTWTGAAASQSLASEKDGPARTGGSAANVAQWAAVAIAVVLAFVYALRACRARRQGYGKLSMMSPAAHELGGVGREDAGHEGLLGNGMRAWDEECDALARSDSATATMGSAGVALGAVALDGLFPEQPELEPLGEPAREAAHCNRAAPHTEPHHEPGSGTLEMLDAAGEAALLARVSELLSLTSDAAMACGNREDPPPDPPPKGGGLEPAQPQGSESEHTCSRVLTESERMCLEAPACEDSYAI